MLFRLFIFLTWIFVTCLFQCCLLYCTLIMTWIWMCDFPFGIHKKRWSLISFQRIIQRYKINIDIKNYLKNLEINVFQFFHNSMETTGNSIVFWVDYSRHIDMNYIVHLTDFLFSILTKVLMHSNVPWGILYTRS